MSNKKVMKRKREEQLNPSNSQDQSTSAQESKRRLNEAVDPTEPTSSTVEHENSLASPIKPNNAKPKPPMNHILMEALEKIIELQNELDAFEHDLDESEEEQRLNAEVAQSFDAQEQRRSEAEALGFAMCARETLLFLENEGVPTNSILYKSLLEKLVGPSGDGLLQT